MDGDLDRFRPTPRKREPDIEVVYGEVVDELKFNTERGLANKLVPCSQCQQRKWQVFSNHLTRVEYGERVLVCQICGHEQYVVFQ